MLIEVNIVVTAVLGFVALLTAGVSVALRPNPLMFWASCCFFAATFQNLVIYFLPGSRVEAYSSVIVATVAFWFANQAVCALTAEQRARRSFHAAFFALLGAAVLTMAWDSAPHHQAFTAELARLVAMMDASWRLAVGRHGKRLRIFMTISFLGLCLLRIVRLVGFAQGDGIDFQHINAASTEVAMAAGESLLGIAIIMFLIIDLVTRKIRSLHLQSERDSLTGLFNRRGLSALAARPSETGGAVICCDIDHFKSINDRFGHHAGDAVIAGVGAILARAGQPAGRIGGEEFSMIAEGFTLIDAMNLAEDLRAQVTQVRHTDLDHQRVTASFGVSIYPPGASARSAFKAADQALYRAKDNGRNTVVGEPTVQQAKERRARAMAG